MSKYQQIKEEACAANKQLPELGLVIFNFGNVSVVDRQHAVFAIKPSGFPYEDLSPKKMVVVDFEGNVVEGKLKPSSDTRTHAVLYKNWKTYRLNRSYPFHLCNGLGASRSQYSNLWDHACRSFHRIDSRCPTDD